MGPAIRIDRLTVRYAESIALEDVSLEVGPGSVCGVVGINGSGKSTLLKTILGAVRPTAGTVTIGGLPPAQSRKAGLLGYVPQDEHIDHSFPINEILVDGPDPGLVGRGIGRVLRGIGGVQLAESGSDVVDVYLGVRP